MAGPVNKQRKYGTTSPKMMGNRQDIIKAGRKNTYRPQPDTAGTQKNPAASYMHRGMPVKKIGTNYRVHEVQKPPAGW